MKLYFKGYKALIFLIILIPIAFVFLMFLFNLIIFFVVLFLFLSLIGWIIRFFLKKTKQKNYVDVKFKVKEDSFKKVK
jgi:uncharacterized protein (DUF58 family)